MRVLTKREEVAKVLNFGKYPVLVLNLDKKPEEDYSVGEKVRVAWDSNRYEGMTSRCELVVEKGQYSLMQGGTCLKANWGMDDFLEDLINANAPLVHSEEIVAVAHYSKQVNIKSIRMMKVSDYINVHCMTVATLEDIVGNDEESVEKYLAKRRW